MVLSMDMVGVVEEIRLREGGGLCSVDWGRVGGARQEEQDEDT